MKGLIPASYEPALRKANLCVIGNLNRDLKTAPLAPGEQLFRDGETSVPFILETIGGGGANSACAATAFGAKVAFLGKVGADVLGARLEKCLSGHGVHTHLAHDNSVLTGTSVGLIFTHGQRHFVSCLPNTEALRFEDLDLHALEGFDHLYRADLWFSRPMLFGGNQRLFEEARARGLAISIDLNWDPCWGVAPADEIRQRKEAVRTLLPMVDLAHGNVRELREFTGAADLQSALRQLETWGVKTVAVHLGSEGAGYYHQGRLIVEPAIPARQQVNTTGTGDVLSVCLMLLHREPDIAAKLRFANQVVTQFIEGDLQLIPAL